MMSVSRAEAELSGAQPERSQIDKSALFVCHLSGRLCMCVCSLYSWRSSLADGGTTTSADE